jgi:hypothetical protein
MAVVEAHATAHLAEATRELVVAPMNRGELETMLLRFGERMLYVLTNDRTALSVYRMVVAESGRSDVGELFRNAGPRAAEATLAAVLAAAMERGDIRKADPMVTASQFLALVTAEVNSRVFQRDPPPLPLEEIQRMVGRAAGMFFAGTTPRT